MSGTDEIKIQVVIAERSYRPTVNKADEAKVLKAAEMLNERIKTYKQTYDYRDYQDLLSMLCLQLATLNVKYESDDLTDEQELHEFQVNLRNLIRRKFMDQTEFAHRLGITQGMVSKYLTGRSVPDVLMLRKMARVLGCSVNDFFYKHY